MIDIGFKITPVGQYIMYAIGGLFILTGVIMGITYIIKNKKIKKDEVNQELKLETVEDQITQVKSRKRRSSKY